MAAHHMDLNIYNKKMATLESINYNYAGISSLNLGLMKDHRFSSTDDDDGALDHIMRSNEEAYTQIC